MALRCSGGVRVQAACGGPADPLANRGTARPERIRCAAEGAGARDRAGGHRRAIPPGPRDGASIALPTQRVSDAITDMPPRGDIVGRRCAMSSTTEPLDTSTLLARIKSRLHAVYGDRLRGVVLYGSEARGEATS